MVTIRKIKIPVLIALFIALIAAPAPARRGGSHAGKRGSAGARASGRHFRGRSAGGHHRGSHKSTSIRRHGGLHHKSGTSHHGRSHHKSSLRRNRRFHHSSGTGHHGLLNHKSGTHHRKNLHIKSGTHHRSGIHHKSGIHHRRHHRSYYVSLPYRRYYYLGYPFYHYYRPRYYYFSLPYHRYYYSYWYYSKPYPRSDYDDSSDSGPGTEQGERYPDADMKGQTEREKAAELPREPGESVQQAKPSRHLDSIAEAFVKADYAKAVERASEGLKAEPDDVVLPFVYVQSLFANRQYSEAAGVLREALRRVDIEKDGVYYPAGFYPDQAVLTEQIKKLTEAVQADSYNADLQLLLGYQLLGVGKYDEALKPLQTAEPDYVNKGAADILIRVLQKARSADSEEAPQTAPKY